MDLNKKADNPRDETLKSLSIKLKQAKDDCRFAVDSDDVERAKSKKRKANDLEDEVDEFLDKK